MRAIAMIAGLGLLMAFAVACDGPPLDSSEAVASNAVAVKDNKFDARVIEVAPGTTVTWTWDAKNSHNVRGDGWGSDVQEEGTFQHTFDTAGEFDYKCTLHPGMKGRVVVQ